MSMRTAELVTEWDSVPFDGGYEGLRALADRDFSGAVVSGPARLFMLNGRVVGIIDGDLEAFEDGDGTARQAPHDALPLLVVMQDRAEEPRAQYYTEDTSISEVDRTLTDGNFTGYVELSENVLSGDYYLVYHQGRSMSVAWVGSAQRLVTDEEAFEQADDEVGIYDVVPAEIEPIELPEPEPEPAVGGADSLDDGTATETDTPGTDVDSAATEAGAATDDEFAEPALETDASESGPTTSPERDERSDDGPNTAPSGPPGSKAAGASQGRTVESDQSAVEEPSAVETPSTSADRTEQRSTDNRETTERAVDSTDVDPDSRPAQRDETQSASPERETEGVESVRRDATADSAGTAPPEPDRPEREPTPVEDEGTGGDTTEPRQQDSAAAEQTEPETEPVEQASAESTPSADHSTAAAALETRSIPSLDPDRSSSDTTVSEPAPESQSTGHQPAETEPTPEPEPTTDDRPTEPAAEPSERQSQSTTPEDRRDDLVAELDEREAEIEQLEGEIRDLSAENEELAAERDRLRSELEAARAEIQRLEEQLETAELPATGGVQLAAAEAIDGTNLFVRYHSKGEATLAKAQDGSADRSAVEENLRLEYHTQFEADDAVVDGVEFETFLQESIHYRFVNWLVRNLLYEIRDTGHANAMSVLYEALPEVDRAELNGNVSVVYTEDGKEHREQQQFDVVVRDRMGNPLVVANINDSRQPATDGQMTDIVRNAERVGNSSGSLAAAFLVTSSFFEPEALETAEEATSSGLFSRDKSKSFVNLSRKDGYHLCLLEARNNEFHLAVPEL